MRTVKNEKVNKRKQQQYYIAGRACCCASALRAGWVRKRTDGRCEWSTGDLTTLDVVLVLVQFLKAFADYLITHTHTHTHTPV